MNFKALLKQSLLWRGVYFFTLLLINICLPRYLQAEDSGTVYFLTNIFALIVLLGGLNIETGLTYYVSKKTIGVGEATFLNGLWSVGVGIWVTVAYGFYLWQFKNYQWANLLTPLYYCFCYMVGIMLLNTSTSIFYAQKNFKTPNAILATSNMLMVLLIVYYSYHPEYAKNQLINFYFLFFFWSGFGVWVALYLQERIKQIKLPTWHQFKPIIHYSLLGLAANFIFFFVYRIDYWFVEHYCTLKDLGNYIQASKMGQLLLVIPQIVASAIFPQTASGSDQSIINQSIQLACRVLLQCFLIIIIATASLGNWLFPLVFGESFDNMYWPMLALLPGIFALCMQVMFAAYFAGRGKIKVNIHGAIIALVIVVVGDFILVPRFGIVAAALVSTMSYVGYFLYSLYQFRKEGGLPLHNFWMIRFSDWQQLLTLIQRKS